MAVKIHFFAKYQVGKIMAPGKSRKDHSKFQPFLSLDRENIAAKA